MKNLLMITMSVFMFSQVVGATSLHPDTFGKRYYGFEQIESAAVSVSALCPKGVVCVANGTQIELTYLISCVEELTSFAYDAMETEGELHLFVSALAGETTGPGAFHCQGFRSVTKTVQLISKYGEVVIHALGVTKQFPDHGDLPRPPLAQPSNN